MLLFAAIAHAEPTVVQYTEGFAPGATAFVLTHNSNLREGASTDSASLARLPLGTAVTVVSDAGEATVAERPGHWYRVRLEDGREGNVFSASLTPFRARVDLDEDGVAEEVFVGFGKDHGIAVNVADTGTAGSVALGVHEDMGGIADTAQVEIRMDAGVPLVRVYLPGSEMCGGASKESFVAWRNDASGKPSGAEVLVGYSGADAPVYSSTEFKFDAKKREVVQEQVYGESLDSGGDAEDVTVTTLRFDGRAYVKVKEKKFHRGPRVPGQQRPE